MTKTMLPALAAALATGDPKTAKELAAEIGKSESRTRELLKEHVERINTRKNDAGKNVFWIDDADLTTIEADAADQVDNDPTEPPAETVDSPATPVQGSCPLCASTSDQVQAGPEGSFLGSAKTCSDCGRTYNAHTGEEVEMPAKAEKTKRTPLNPQYKINAKIDAAKAAGGKLVYDKATREWVLSKGKNELRRMSAKDFSVETAETITAALA